MKKNPFELQKDTSMGVYPGLVYRHFKGGYYLVQSVNIDTELYTDHDPGNPDAFRVTYQSLNGDLRTWSRPLNEFLSYVPGGAACPDNVTGQNRRFECIVNLNKPLSAVDTAALVDELSRRDDSPFRNSPVASDVFYEDYVVCRMEPNAFGNDENIHVMNMYDSAARAMEEAALSPRFFPVRRAYHRMNATL